jgi:hypothetical protein
MKLDGTLVTALSPTVERLKVLEKVLGAYTYIHILLLTFYYYYFNQSDDTLYFNTQCHILFTDNAEAKGWPIESVLSLIDD